MDAQDAIAFVLLAEFDIEQGSKISAIYPENCLPKLTSSNEDELSDYMVPEGAHNTENQWTIFLLNRTKSIRKVKLSDDWEMVEPGNEAKTHRANEASYEELSPFPLLYCINLTHTRKDAASKRGAEIKSLCIGCRHQFYHLYKPFIWHSLGAIFEAAAPGTPSDALTKLYSSGVAELFAQVSAFDFALPLQLWRDYRDIFSYGFNGGAKSFPIETQKPKRAWGSVLDLPPSQIFVPLNYSTEETNEASILTLVNIFKDKVMTLYNALLMERRVILIGPNWPSGSVCKLVLGCCLMLAPLSGVLADRAFPFVHFGNDSFLQSKGYIIGVTNPVFRDKEVLWDVLCDVSTGEIREGKAGARPIEPDRLFIKKVLAGIQLGGDESWVRRQFNAYTQDVIDASLGKPVAHAENASPKKDSPFVTRMIQWSETRTYLRYMQDYGFKKSRITKIDLDSTIRQLRIFALNGAPTGADEDKATTAFTDLVEVVETDEDIIELFGSLAKQAVDMDDILSRFKKPFANIRVLTKHERNARRLAQIVHSILIKQAKR